jgi:hypothetical protein
MRNTYVIIAVIFLMFGSLFAFADDGAYSEAGGGADSPMKPNSSIRMVRERVDIRLGQKGAVVKCVFEFKNEGEACSVQMGFPESQWASGEGGIYGGLEHFVSFIDGQKAEVKHRFPSEKHSYDNGQDRDYTSWYVKNVDFAKGQTRIVEDDYFSRYGQSSSSGALEAEAFTYVLVTGATWKGTIGEIEINIDTTKLGNMRDIKLPKGCMKSGNKTWKWTAKDIEPKQDFHITLRQRDLLLNGKDMGMSIGPWNRLEDPQGIVMIDAGFFEAVGGISEVDLKKGACTIKYGSHTLIMKEHTLKAKLDSKTVSLPIQIKMAHNYDDGKVMVPLKTIVKWFGGSVTTDKKTGKLDIHLKQLAAR